MIDFYTYPTFNGYRVAIMLEETGLNYQLHTVDLSKGAHKHADFLGINPSGRIPTIIDHDEENSLVVTQSAAILIYLAEKTELFLPTTTMGRAKVMEWLFFHASDISPTLFDSFFLSNRCQPAQLTASQLLDQRIFELYKNFDTQLVHHEFIAGDEYSIADIAIFPTLKADDKTFFDTYPHLKRWYATVGLRPAVQQGMK